MIQEDGSLSELEEGRMFFLESPDSRSSPQNLDSFPLPA